MRAVVAKILRINSNSTCCWFGPSPNFIRVKFYAGIFPIELHAVEKSWKVSVRIPSGKMKAVGAIAIEKEGAEKEGDLQRMIYESR